MRIPPPPPLDSPGYARLAHGRPRLAWRVEWCPERAPDSCESKGLPLIVILLLALFPLVAAAQTLEEELRSAEEQLAAALIARRAETFERLLSPGFVLRGAPDVPREQWIRNAVSLCWGDRFDISSFAVVINTADSAVVSLLLTTHLDPVTCEPALVRSLLTDVWVRDGAVWRLALRHSAPPAASVTGQFEKTAPPPPRWERSAELSLVATGGNTDTQTLGTVASVTWRPGAWTSRARAAFVRSATDDVVTAESLVTELRQSRALTARAEVFARAEYLVDRFSGIDHRSALDGGVGWLFIDQAGHKLEVDGGIGVTHEVRLAGDDLTFAAGTGSALYTWQISPTTLLTERPVVLVALGEPGNWRVQNRLELSVAMTRRLSVRLGHELKRVNRPVEGFRKTDTVLSAALVVRF